MSCAGNTHTHISDSGDSERVNPSNSLFQKFYPKTILSQPLYRLEKVMKLNINAYICNDYKDIKAERKCNRISNVGRSLVKSKYECYVNNTIFFCYNARQEKFL